MKFNWTIALALKSDLIILGQKINIRLKYNKSPIALSWKKKKVKEFSGFTASSDHLGEKKLLFHPLWCQILLHFLHCTAC